MSKYKDMLELELKRIGSLASLVTMNVAGERDCGVAVWFTRKRDTEDFTWREVLGLTMPFPTAEQIRAAYIPLARKYHTDPGSAVGTSTGDLELFKRVTQARDKALIWAEKLDGKRYDFVIPADAFKERRLNLAAIVGTIQAIRKIERCGSSALMERSWKGFETAQLTEGNHVVATPS